MKFARPIPLCILVLAAHEGSGQVHIDKLLPSLVAMGCDTTFAGWDRHKQFPGQFEKNGVTCRMIFRGWGYANKWLALALPLWTVCTLLFLLRQRPDVAMAIDFDTGLPAALAQLVTGVPFIYNIRDNYAMRTTLPRLLRPVVATLDQWVIRHAMRVIVPDENRITATDERTRSKFAVICNCAPDVRPASGKADRRPFTVYAMGYLGKARGTHLLLEAAAHLPDIRILLAGSIRDRDTEEQIHSTPNADFRGRLAQEDALQLCFESDVIFTFYDPVSEINRRAASNKWSDAMMASRPILVNSEVLKSVWIKEEDIGYLCPYGDVDQLVQVIQHIRQHPEEARRKGENGRRLYDTGYSWTVMEQRLWHLLDEVSQNRSGGRKW